MTTPDSQHEHYLLHIRALPDVVPPEVRLRRWLKLGGRSFGLRCERVEPAVEEQPQAQEGER